MWEIAEALAVVFGVGLPVLGLGRWLYLRNKPVSVKVANPEAVATEIPKGAVLLNKDDFVRMTNEARDKAVAERDALHGRERAVLEEKIAELNRRLANPEEALAQQHAIIVALEEKVAQFGNQIGGDRIAEAKAALEQGDYSLADEIFAEIEGRNELAVQETARAAFGRGEVAEAEIRWHDACTYYRRAVDLNDTVEHVAAYARMTWRLAKGAEAIEAYDRLAELVKTEHGEHSAEYAAHLNNNALVLKTQGHYQAAEALHREALEIDRSTIGERHPEYAKGLSNLAAVLKAQGRYQEAERLFREALEIGREAIGEGPPDYATYLNNLASVVEDQGRYAEAEGLYREALEIGRVTIGEGHPDYAIRLNNLAGVLQTQRRYEEAEGLYREALEIDRVTTGEKHPDNATHLNNLAGVVLVQGRYEEAEGLYREALEIDRATIGEGHSDYAIDLGNLGQLLGQMGRTEEAREMLEQCLTIFRDTLPPDHPHIAEAERRIAALPEG